MPEAATEASMAEIRKGVIRLKQELPLPAWVTSFVAAIVFLKKHDVFDELQVRLRVARQGGYVMFDLLMVMLGMYFAQTAGGIKGFCKAVQPFQARVAAIVQRKKLPGSSSISRMATELGNYAPSTPLLL